MAADFCAKAPPRLAAVFFDRGSLVLLSNARDRWKMARRLYLYSSYPALHRGRRASPTVLLYLTTLPADFLPWTIFLIPALFAFRPYRRRWADPVVQFFVLWFFSVFLFFTFSDTKRDLYLLPLMPTLALFVGSYFDDLATGKIALSAAYQGLTIAFFGLVVIAGFAVPCVAWFVRRDAFAAMLPTSLVLLIGGSGAVLFLWRRRPLQAAASIAAMMALTCFRRDWLTPYLENFKSPRLFSQQVNQIVPATLPVYVYADTMNDFNFYTAREVMPILSTPLALDALLARGQGGYLLIGTRSTALTEAAAQVDYHFRSEK